MDEGHAAFRHWRDLLTFSRGKQAERDGVEYLRACAGQGRVFELAGDSLARHVDGYAEYGLTAPLRAFWPALEELVSGNDIIAERMAELGGRAHIVEFDDNGFNASSRRFTDESCIVQLDTGLLLTIFEIVQLFVQISMPDPESAPGVADLEAAVLLELVKAEYRLLGENATPKALLPTPAQGKVIGELAQAANVFVLAHEVSHLLLDHDGDRNDDQRRQDEVSSDVLGLRILSGTYSARPSISTPQARGRLLGARLLFFSIELVERATFVTRSRTHPSATDRWAVARAAAEQVFEPSVPADVDRLWAPMERLLSLDRPELAKVEETLTALETGERYIGAAADAASATEMIRLFRLTEAGVDDLEPGSGATSLASTARAELQERAAISWSALLRLRSDAGGGGVEQHIVDAVAAAHLLVATDTAC